MFKFLKNLFKDANEKELEKLEPIVEEINSLEPKMQVMSDQELKAKTEEFKERHQAGETLDQLLPEAFAVVREASQRATEAGFRHYDVQLVGGIVLHQGKIAEMKTGEGKTLAATLPVYLNALTGKGVHVVTVNDYLAERDSEWMGQIYRFLGMSVGVILSGMSPAERREAYNCDITYGTNNEFGFDYLRDNMAYKEEDLVQREHHYAILDEVDSILIDEARTPLIISGPVQEKSSDYRKFNRVIPNLKKDEDYEIDEKNKLVTLTEAGVKKAEKKLNVDNLYSEENFKLNHQLNQALKAHTLMKKDRDYIVKDGAVKIVDEFTGRVMEGRRYSEGLHQAIEAKEGVEVQKGSQTFAKITLQNFFRMYNKLAGMTGTAETEEEEFVKIYDMPVVVVPTNEPMIRDDMADLVFTNKEAKYKAVIKEIKARYDKGQPVLVGTADIENSEMLSRELKKVKVPHEVLNAKNHEREADIIKDAGQKKSVTIATNMAGRGTDIVLGDGVVELGGLHVLGTERHESRRIDNQLRGRAGRQGDPGSSQFYVSLEDDLLRLFGSDKINGILDKLGVEEDQPVEHKLISNSIERAQQKVEGRNFDIRKAILEYDDILNKQREVIYDQRKTLLTTDELEEKIAGMLEQLLDDVMEMFISEDLHPDEWDLEGMLEYLNGIGLAKDISLADIDTKTKAEIKEKITLSSLGSYETKREKVDSDRFNKIIKFLSLRVIDRKWMNHLDNMDELRQGIGLRAYGQKDPLTEYKFESFDMFNELTASIREDIVETTFKVEVEERERITKEQINQNQFNYSSPEAALEGQSKGSDKSNAGDGSIGQNTVVKEEEPGRNDPCPCGSGKKYKKCCGR
ncbi:MAG: preprotein translocase subunit SecA [Halanaerobium sp. 4-GBenrich]|jgi:preprotein translocase subunit SecA|uniref:Protein translocase subunit SecA n=1 Tax=Halanaerobium congolense TaxID=54121 RepID=A0A1M7P7Y8_9FIRM|nr:preprotein translocase subunit SecA [Halanaerobium congolense]KXS48717.1 MAG: preprotein translocase subunit SecA [Halanaerobium sp. T82-1]ODS50623.1 MAG: preprotein translocase subunit SecA [Halanaerobium sp. 4-GBenrich]OEG62231.1 MAG: preprotein translocase subunit SecA [Halanaerobium sp. MDAL1]PUU91257.1 MAG: preprotein translocase subunit SecA [Halanaerobium sp.]PTX15770.1 preprotein translocase subunit SecA [Halanaerobium congolense]